MKRFFKMLLSIIASIIILIVLVVVLFIRLSPEFGGEASVVQKVEYAKSENFSDGKFVNKLHEYNLLFMNKFSSLPRGISTKFVFHEKTGQLRLHLNDLLL